MLVHNERLEVQLTWRDVCRLWAQRIWYGTLALLMLGAVFLFFVVFTFLLVGFITLP